MDLWLVRHAIAVPRGGDVLDHARPLTPKGRARFEREVRGLYGLGVRFDRVYHSPWARAAQTAELLKPIATGERLALDALARPPDDDLLEALEGAGASVALVGHEPWMSELAALLLLGDPDLADRFSMKKGGMAHLQGDPGPAACRLVAFYPPKTLRRLTA